MPAEKEESKMKQDREEGWAASDSDGENTAAEWRKRGESRLGRGEGKDERGRQTELKRRLGGGGVRWQDERGGIEGREVGIGAERIRSNEGSVKREQKRLTRQ